MFDARFHEDAQHAQRPPSVFGTRGLALGVVTGWAFIALVDLPNFHNATQRGRQKRTSADLRSVSTAVEAYAVDHGLYPDTMDVAQLAELLEPTYIEELPVRDGWGWNLEYLRVEPHGFVVRSPGSDGRFEKVRPTAYADGPVEGFHRDLVFSTVSGSQWPEGLMGP